MQPIAATDRYDRSHHSRDCCKTSRLGIHEQATPSTLTPASTIPHTSKIRKSPPIIAQNQRPFEKSGLETRMTASFEELLKLDPQKVKSVRVLPPQK